MVADNPDLRERQRAIVEAEAYRAAQTADLELLTDDDEIRLSLAPDGGVDITIVTPWAGGQCLDDVGQEATIRLTAEQADIVLTYLWDTRSPYQQELYLQKKVLSRP